jgi:hypothetical protein
MQIMLFIMFGIFSSPTAFLFPHVVLGPKTILSITSSILVLQSNPYLLSFTHIPMNSASTLSVSVDTPQGAIYKSGKNPSIVDLNNPKKGSKKDSGFLRCVSNCKSDCELPTQGKATQRVVRLIVVR